MNGGIKLFICTECGCLFEEPVEWEERHGLDTPPYEKWSGCPQCHGNYVETYQCDCCGEWIEDYYIRIGDDRYCQNCYVEYALGEG